MAKEQRFNVVFREGSYLDEKGILQILVDKETGVNYLLGRTPQGVGITPLLDSEGKVVITKQ